MASDTQILTAVGDILTAHLPVGWKIVQNYQATGQARDAGPTVYFAKLTGDTQVGFPKRTMVWNEVTQAYSNVLRQAVQSTIRVQGFANVDDPAATLTPGDVAGQAALALQTDDARAMLKAIDAAPLRIQQMPAIGMADERDRWEIAVTFDFLLVHRRDMVRAQPSATLGGLDVHAV